MKALKKEKARAVARRHDLEEDIAALDAKITSNKEKEESLSESIISFDAQISSVSALISTKEGELSSSETSIAATVQTAETSLSLSNVNQEISNELAKLSWFFIKKKRKPLKITSQA